MQGSGFCENSGAVADTNACERYNRVFDFMKMFHKQANTLNKSIKVTGQAAGILYV